MVLEKQLVPYFQWLLSGDGEQFFGALPRFLLVMGGLGLFALIVGYVIAAGRRGLLAGGDATYRTVVGGLGDLARTSPRRIWALALLAIKEARRRRVVFALGLFLLILLFASWFLRTDMQQPARLYLSFVLTATTYLVLVISLILSAFSLPTDFKTKTIYTVVTKPVHASEIVLGRILGFTIVATALLAFMGLCSYVFVVRSLNHEHRLDAADLQNVADAANKIVRRTGKTSTNAGHSHDVTVDPDGQGQALIAGGHTHDVVKDGDEYRVGPPLGYVQARVPQYGKLRFIDRSGAPKDRGISVGNEWAYRSFIDGNTPATAIWTFDGVDESVAETSASGEQSLPLALTVRVFRTHKGIVGRRLTGTIQLRNPETNVTSSPLPFDALDQQVDQFDLLRKQKSATGQDLDLFDDLADGDGRIEVLVKCLEGGQYFGFAQADCYVRRADGDPLANFCRVLASIWVQSVVIIAVGVTISTLVSGPVAMLFTFAFLILGLWRQDFLDIATGKNYGGGPAESIVRIATQANVITKLEDTPLNNLVQGFDTIVSKPLMWCVAQCLPDFSSLSTVRYAADGYDVPWNRVFQDATLGLGYVAGLAVLGFFLLRTREVAR
jgi:ABC-type transport system involved in multi-copper enzyme maturation permease subunit